MDSPVLESSTYSEQSDKSGVKLQAEGELKSAHWR